MNKTYRQGQILRLIRSRKLRTQEALAEALLDVGIEASQVTLSRDIQELGLVKTPDGYQTVDRIHRTPPNIENVVAEFLLDSRVAQNLLVLKTSPGNASSLAVRLDQQEWPEITGTIAGDDTILVITPDNEAAAALRLKLLAMLEG